MNGYRCYYKVECKPPYADNTYLAFVNVPRNMRIDEIKKILESDSVEDFGNIEQISSTNRAEAKKYGYEDEFDSAYIIN